MRLFICFVAFVLASFCVVNARIGSSRNSGSRTSSSFSRPSFTSSSRNSHSSIGRSHSSFRHTTRHTTKRMTTRRTTTYRSSFHTLHTHSHSIGQSHSNDAYYIRHTSKHDYERFIRMNPLYRHRSLRYRNRLNDTEERKWRTTRAPTYFHNYYPQTNKVLAASAVLGAAAALGVISYLPLNVPIQMPLMYCNDTEFAQAHIRINDQDVFFCHNNTVEVSCLENENGDYRLHGAYLTAKANAELKIEDIEFSNEDHGGEEEGKTEKNLEFDDDFFEKSEEIEASSTTTDKSTSYESIELDASMLKISEELILTNTIRPNSNNGFFTNSSTSSLGDSFENSSSNIDTSNILSGSSLSFSNDNQFSGFSQQNPHLFSHNSFSSGSSPSFSSSFPSLMVPMNLVSLPPEEVVQSSPKSNSDIDEQDSSSTSEVPKSLDNSASQPCINRTDRCTSTNDHNPLNLKFYSNDHQCRSKTFQCDAENADDSKRSIICRNSTLKSQIGIFCNSTIKFFDKGLNEIIQILNCYEGQISENNTIVDVTVIPATEQQKTTTELPKTATPKLYEWLMPVPKKNEDGSYGSTIIAVPDSILDEYKPQYPGDEPPQYPIYWIKHYFNSTEPLNDPFTETPTSSTILQFTEPYIWMRPKFSDGNDGTVLEPVPKDLVDITENFKYEIPSDWVKIMNSEIQKTTTEKITRRPRTKRTTTTKRSDVWDDWDAVDYEEITTKSTEAAKPQKSKSIGDFINAYIMSIIKSPD